MFGAESGFARAKKSLHLPLFIFIPARDGQSKLFPPTACHKASPFHEHSTQCNFPSIFSRSYLEMYLTLTASGFFTTSYQSQLCTIYLPCTKSKCVFLHHRKKTAFPSFLKLKWCSDTYSTDLPKHLHIPWALLSVLELTRERK